MNLVLDDVKELMAGEYQSVTNVVQNLVTDTL
jgi:small nuclear ribonucleoprotein (snRNP)-like protein